MRSPEGNEPPGEAPEGPTTVETVIQRLKDLRRQRDVVEYPYTTAAELRQGEEEVTRSVERLLRSGGLSEQEKEDLFGELVDFLYDADPSEIPASDRLRDLQDDLRRTMKSRRPGPPHS
jgi:hypothetical protein